MRHAVVSTVGTSLLTNAASEELRRLLSRAANLREEELPPGERDALRDRAGEVEARLASAPETEVRRMSAELNGVLSLGASDRETCHYLLCTDTYPGRLTTDLVGRWLRARGAAVVPIVLEGFSTANRAAFARGVDFLLRWCEQTLPPMREQGWRITFNLAGSFKSLQAYAQTLGMFYADEIVYIFEGTGAELIRIPRLPVAWQTADLERHAAAVARLAQGELLPAGELADLPEAYLESDGACVTLSDWGWMAWNLNRKRILGGDLVEQPGLLYSDEFRRDYDRRRDPNERAALQDTLAKASVLWREGGLRRLRGDGGVQYEDLMNRGGVGHFRVTLSLRVTCEPAGERLRLRRFGPHDVNENP